MSIRHWLAERYIAIDQTKGFSAGQLAGITEYKDDAYGTLTFVLDFSSKVAQHIYNLLGYGILSQKTEELAIAVDILIGLTQNISQTLISPCRASCFSCRRRSC